MLLLALAFLPALGLARLVRENWTDLPYSDEWHTSLGTPLALFREGALRPADLWAQHTESRPLFPRLVALALVGRAGNWDVRVGMVISLLEAAAISALLYHLLGQGRPAPGAAARAAMLLPINCLLFTPAGWEVWLWGLEAMVFAPLLCLAVALRVNVSTTPGLRAKALINAALAFVATFSFANGLLLWPLAWPIRGFPAPGSSEPPAPRARRERWTAGAIYGLAAAASLGFYFHGFVPNDPRAVAYALGHPGELARYFLTWCSGALLPPPPPGAAHVALGLALVLGFAAAATWLLGRSRGNPEARRAGYPWIMLGLGALGSGGLTALGRTQGGLEFALSSRYVVNSDLLPIALLGLAFVIGRFFAAPAALSGEAMPPPAGGGLSPRPPWRAVAAVVAALALLGGGWLHARASGRAVLEMRNMHRVRELARDALTFADVIPDDPQLPVIFAGALRPLFHRLHAVGLVKIRTASASMAAAWDRDLPPAGEDQAAHGSFDVCRPAPGGHLAVTGWASDPASPPGQRPAGFVVFTLSPLDAAGQPSGRPRPFTAVRTAERRADVAAVLSNPAMATSGFNAVLLHPPSMPPATAGGRVRIAAWAANPETGQVWPLSHQHDLDLGAGR